MKVNRIKNINILTTEYAVSFVDKIPPMSGDTSDSFYFGTVEHSTRKIIIATKDIDGNALKEKDILTSLLHEIVHAIYAEGCYSNSNEPAVQWVANNLTALLLNNDLVK